MQIHITVTRDTVVAQNGYSDGAVYNSKGINNLLSKCL